MHICNYKITAQAPFLHFMSILRVWQPSFKNSVSLVFLLSFLSLILSSLYFIQVWFRVWNNFIIIYNLRFRHWPTISNRMRNFLHTFAPLSTCNHKQWSWWNSQIKTSTDYGITNQSKRYSRCSSTHAGEPKTRQASGSAWKYSVSR